MSHPESAFRLDTGAYQSARAARLSRTVAYWALLIVATGAVAAAVALLAPRLGVGSGDRLASVKPKAVAALPPAPAPATTPVTVWNASRANGAATRAGARLEALGYPVPTKANADVTVRGTWVMYAPGSKMTAVEVARGLGLRPERTVRPLDGVKPEAIRPAVVLVLLGR